MSNRNLAIIFSILMGGMGVQKFFTRNYVGGIFMVIFSWTMIPAIIGLIDAFKFSNMTDEEFDERYYGRRKTWSRYDSNTRHVAREEAIEIERKRNEAIKKAEIRRKQKELKREETLQKIQKILSLRKEGVKLYNEFELEDAKKTFLSVLKLDPNDIPALFNLACISSQNGNLENAYKYLTKAVQAGFTDYDKIEAHPAFSSMRLENKWDEFRRRGYKFIEDETPIREQVDLLDQINQSRSKKKAEELLEEIVKQNNDTSR